MADTCQTRYHFVIGLGSGTLVSHVLTYLIYLLYAINHIKPAFLLDIASHHHHLIYQPYGHSSAVDKVNLSAFQVCTAVIYLSWCSLYCDTSSLLTKVL